MWDGSSVDVALQTQRVEYIPPAILGTVGISGTLYIMLAVALCVMVTPTQLNECADDRGDPDPLYHAPLTAADSLVCASDYSNKCAYIADKTQSPYSVMAWSLGYVFAFNEQGMGRTSCI